MRFLIVLFLLIGCSSTQLENLHLVNVSNLSKELTENSGLSFYNNSIYTHNDELGIIYEIAPSTGQILNSIDFDIKDDFEGIEIISNEAILVNSKGKIYSVNLESKKTKTHKIKFKNKEEIEGICINLFKKDHILLACKASDSNKEKYVFNYDLINKKIDKNPFFKIKLKSLLKYAKSNNLSKKRIEKFAPSGIAISPQSKEIFITSARGSLLAIFSQDKKLKKIVELNSNILPQPEGICFNLNNQLFISSEGKNDNATLCEFLLK